MTTGISRRTWLSRAAAGGATLALGMARLRNALAAGAVASGVYRVRGDVRINGKPAKQGMQAKAGAVITTGRDAELVMVVARDAFLVRADSRTHRRGAGSARKSGRPPAAVQTWQLLTNCRRSRPSRAYGHTEIN